jgi:sporulation protein YlmC with PRC-barrel domain
MGAVCFLVRNTRFTETFLSGAQTKEQFMTTTSGHTSAILASKVKGTAVYNTRHEKIGHVEDIMLDKTSDEVMYAVLGFGGFLGIGEKYHPMPWSSLDYDPQVGGYVIPMSKEVLERAPVYDLNDLTDTDGNVRQKTTDYYGSL